MYLEEDYLKVSGIQHFAFCRRQWALIHIEQQWNENYLTASGRKLHEKAHKPELKDKRGNLVRVRAVRISSPTYGLTGECDVIELCKDEIEGIPLQNLIGKYTVLPIEYKHGSPATAEYDEIQLCAQVLCLEEMLCCKISKGSLYYGKIKKRVDVFIDDVLRSKTVKLIEEMHNMFAKHYTPKVRPTKGCKACSLKDICLPKLNLSYSASEYMHKMLED